MTDGELILLIEDDKNLASSITFNLDIEGYRVLWAEEGRQAMTMLENDDIDLIILDIMLPYYNGFKILEKIRSNSPTLPILIVSARSEIRDKIIGLSLGADDYLPKPFHLRELLLRISGMLRRRNWYRKNISEMSKLSFGENRIDFENSTCKSSKGSFRLTPLESALLKCFVLNEDQILSKQELLKKVWKASIETETRTVDNFVMRLRKYFEEDPSKPVYFKNIRNRGYIFSTKGK